jgi:acetyl-CoA C-acetyltransferase
MAKLIILPPRAVEFGGTESISSAPYLLPQALAGYRYGSGELVNSILSEG